MRVLIVEDDEDQALVLQRFIEKQGHTPEVANTGQDAFARFRQEATTWRKEAVTSASSGIRVAP